MTDVRLTATTPTGDVVYVLANAKGELRLEEPIEFDGNLDGDLYVAGTVRVGEPGSATYALDVRGEAGIDLYNNTGGGNVLNFRPALGDGSKYNMSISSCDLAGDGTGNADGLSINSYSGVSIATGSNQARQERFRVDSQGNVGIGGIRPAAKLDVDGDVIVGSRGLRWLIRESNGVAMLIEQAAYLSNQDQKEVRDLPSEIDACLKALNEVMQRLRMTPPDGWPVWDGSDIS